MSGGKTHKGESMRYVIVSFVFAFVGSLEANPCWGQVPFGPVGPPVVPYSPVASTNSYSWVWQDGDLIPAGWIALHDGNRYVGRLQPDTGLFVWGKTGKQIDLAALVAEHNPSRGAGPVGSLPISQAPQTPQREKPELCECDEKNGCKGGRCVCKNPDCKGPCHTKRKDDLFIGQKIEFPPVDQPNPADRIPPGGVMLDKISAEHKYFCRGRECTRAEAMSALDEAANVPDDANALRLTVIGSDAARTKFLADWRQSPDLAAWRDKFIVTEYPPDHWRIKDGGFKVPTDDREPVVYLQMPDGTVLYRLDNWEAGKGAPALAKALRERVPNYDPNKDPTPKGAGDTKNKILNEVLWFAAIGAVVGVVLLVRRKA